jgi:glycosidase
MFSINTGDCDEVAERRINLLADVYVRENDTWLCFGNDKLEFRFSRSTGNLIAGFDKTRDHQFLGKIGDEVPALLLRVGGRIKYPGVVRNSRVYELENYQEIGSSTVFASFNAYARDREAVLVVSAGEGDWVIESIYYLSPGDGTLSRDLRVTYTGEGEVLLRDVRFWVPFLSVGSAEDTVLEAPDYPVTAHYPLEAVPYGVWEGLDSRTLSAPGKVQHSVDAPGSVVGLIALHNPQDGTSVLCWPHSTSEFSIMEVVKDPDRVHFVQWLFLADRFRDGHSVQAGRQHLRVESGGWDQVMSKFQDWYEDIELRVPQDRPGWALGTAIYEVHVGRAPFLNGIDYEPYPLMRDLLEDLPRIADMGFEVIQLMPHWPFCGYTVYDYHQIDQQYGNKEDLISVVDLAHDLGMKVILDIVLHGCIDKEIIRWDMAQFGSHYDFIFKEWLESADERSRYRDEKPEWFMQDEDERTAKIYTWAFDPANRSFQEFIVSLLKDYILDLGVDGFRFDAPTWNCMPNWKRGIPYRASASYYGAFHLLNRVREEIKQIAPDALLYTEPSGPLFRYSMDLTYNYDVEWLSGSLMKPVSKRGFAGAAIYTGEPITAKEAAQWLHFHRLSLPRDSLTVQHLDSHDTYWWGELAQFRHEAFGVQASRALFAVFALLGGGIMTYVGAEKGSEDFYKRLINLRQINVTLRYGDCESLAVTCDDEMVLPLLRTYHNHSLVSLINLGEEETETVVQLPIERFNLGIHADVLVYDIFNGSPLSFEGKKALNKKDLGNLAVTIPGYGVRILNVIPLER